jgi:VIT1/CCC1 family predicted Fe2+/Mn2+ transporter
MHHPEYHASPIGPKLNRLRAAVLGANDGIVSIAGLVFGIAGATSESSVIVATGIAGIVAGALSMAVGEYVSVSSSRDSEHALLAKEKFELQAYPEQEFKELQTIYEQKGLTKETAEKVARELTEHNAFLAHVEAELKIDPEHLTNPIQAAFSSAGAFVAGALIPLIAISLPSADTRVPIAAVAVILALSITGFVSASIGGSAKLKAILRVLIGGIAAMAITYGVGLMVGAAL